MIFVKTQLACPVMVHGVQASVFLVENRIPSLEINPKNPIDTARSKLGSLTLIRDDNLPVISITGKNIVSYLRFLAIFRGKNPKTAAFCMFYAFFLMR